MLSNWIIVALLLLVSHNARRPAVVGPTSDVDQATSAPSARPGRQSAATEGGNP